MGHLHFALSLLQRHERRLTRLLVLLLGRKQISLRLRFDGCNLALPDLLLLSCRSSCLVRSSAQLRHRFFALLQLQQGLTLLLLCLSPKRCERIAKA